jgi:hypothetical protein
MSAQIVIRSSQREAYFAHNGEWSQRMGNARTFASVTEAEALCRNEKLGEVEILVLRANRPPMRIPVGGKPEKCRPASQRDQSSAMQSADSGQ